MEVMIVYTPMKHLSIHTLEIGGVWLTHVLYIYVYTKTSLFLGEKNSHIFVENLVIHVFVVFVGCYFAISRPLVRKLVKFETCPIDL